MGLIFLYNLRFSDSLQGRPDIKIWAANISKDSATICWQLQLIDKSFSTNIKINYMLIFDLSESKASSENSTNVISELPCCCYILENLKPGAGYDFWVKPIPNTVNDEFNIVFMSLTSARLFISAKDYSSGIPY